MDFISGLALLWIFTETTRRSGLNNEQREQEELASKAGIAKLGAIISLCIGILCIWNLSMIWSLITLLISMMLFIVSAEAEDQLQ